MRLVAWTWSCHGAVPMTSNQVGLAHPHSSVDTVTLLSRTGAVLSFRRDLRTPFAAWLAAQALVRDARPALPQKGDSERYDGIGEDGALDCFKRFELAQVQRQVRYSDLPTTLCIADLDIITPAPSPAPGATPGPAGSGRGGGQPGSGWGLPGGGGGQAARERLVAEAQAIKALVQVVEGLPPEVGRRWEVRLNH
ncbi:uncharacterized protein HaLaN_21950, partial [Haematococcus lacustris]